jgi:hypothetical protein
VFHDARGTVYTTQLAVYPSTHLAAAWVRQFAHLDARCTQVLLPTGLEFGAGLAMTTEKHSDLAPQPGALHRLGAQQTWGHVDHSEWSAGSP